MSYGEGESEPFQGREATDGAEGCVSPVLQQQYSSGYCSTLDALRHQQYVMWHVATAAFGHHAVNCAKACVRSPTLWVLTPLAKGRLNLIPTSVKTGQATALPKLVRPCFGQVWGVQASLLSLEPEEVSAQLFSPATTLVAQRAMRR